MKYSKKLKRVVSYMLILVLLVTTCYVDSYDKIDAAYQNVTVSVDNKPQVDILLSRGKTRTNTANFETDLRNALNNLNVDTTNVRFIQNDSVQMVGQAGFNQYTWTKVTNGLGDYYFNGANLEGHGNPSWGGSMQYYSVMPDSAYKYTMDFDYSTDYGDNFYGVGIYFGGTLGGNAAVVYLDRYGPNFGDGVLYGNHTAAVSTVKGYCSSSGHIHIENDNGNVSINGVTLDGVYDGKNWGFWTSQYDHGCSSIGHFSYSNLVVNIETSKEFKKVLTEEQDNWTSGYKHILVNCLDETTENVFDRNTNKDEYYNILNLLNISNIHFIQWGTNSNQSLMTSYINQLPTGGAFYNLGSYDSNSRQMTNYNTCITQTATYIRDLILQSRNTDCVIIDRPTSISVEPNDARNHNLWSFEHDITQVVSSIGTYALNNDLGYSNYQGANNRTFPSDFQFDKPGTYYLSYNNQLVKRVTAHRLPTAIITMVGNRQLISGHTYRYNFRSDSFDIDSNADTYGRGKGIKELKWRYRRDGGAWTTVGTNQRNYSFDINTDYNTDIQLEVTDFLGAKDIANITINNSSKPVAYFSFASNPISLYESINIIDSSYDPLGRNIVSREWTIKNSDNTVIWTGTSKPTINLSNHGIGTYKVSLKVKNSESIESYTYTATLVVKRVLNNALFEYNWKNGYHSNGYASSIGTEYLTAYPSLPTPSKYYTVTYDKNTGTYVSKTSDSKYSTFGGWYKEANLTSRITSSITQVTSTGNHYIYAKWTDGSVSLPSAEKKYTVTYNGNGTSNDVATTTKASDTETWTFNGWYDSTSGGGYKGTTNSSYVVSKNETLYARWTDVPITLTSATKSLKLTYNGNGGIPTKAYDEKYAEFKGWYTASSGGTLVGTNGDAYTVNNNHTLYAHWGNASYTLTNATRNYTLTYDANGGIVSTSSDTKPVEFKGWYTLPTGGVRVGGLSDSYSTSVSTTLYAQWGKATYVLPNATKEGYEFLGWFTKPQNNGSFNNSNDAVYLGKGGDTVSFEEPLTIYAWYNYIPVFSNSTASNVFYEGQTIDGNDLLKLIKVTDAENGDLTSSVELVNVKYTDGTVVPFEPTTILNTETSNIGNFYVTYQVTDMGISINNGVITESPITVTYTMECEIRYNDLPSIELKVPYIYIYSGDTTLKDTTIKDFIHSYVYVNDAQDTRDHSIWWLKNHTEPQLQSTVTYKVKDIELDAEFKKTNSGMVDVILGINSLEGIYSLKNTFLEAFNAITSFKVEIDAHDQFGKYASGNLNSYALLKGVERPQNVQSTVDRELLVIKTNDSSYNNAYTNLRYVSAKYVDTVTANSYWGDYGKDTLRDILDKRDKIVYAEEGTTSEIKPKETYIGEYTQSSNNVVKIIVNDYTD